MAKFKEGDWVKITPQPDKMWSGWTNTHDQYCNKVGYIEGIWEHNGYTTCDVVVNFPYGINGSEPGEFYMTFLSDHLILSTKYDAELSENLEKAGKELQDWENFKRQATDNILKDVFSPPKRTKKTIKEQEEDAWEAVTQDYTIPEQTDNNRPYYTDEEIDDLINQYASDLSDMDIFYDHHDDTD
jgi:hypothetical protein